MSQRSEDDPVEQTIPLQSDPTMQARPSTLRQTALDVTLAGSVSPVASIAKDVSSSKAQPTSAVQVELANTNPLDQMTLAQDFVLPSVSANSNNNVGKRFGDYRVEAEIARGGMGVVYRAHQISLNRPVAIKMILSGNLAGDEDVKRFYVEAEAAAKLEHPNIVPIYEIGQLDGQHFFSMGLVDGGSLDRLLSENTLPAKAAVELMLVVCDAIQFAHDHGIIHRDLKPANILLAKSSLTRSGQSSATQRTASSGQRVSTGNSVGNSELEWVPKVSDFGLAKQLNSKSELTGTGQILGTPSYMPPEQADGSNDLVGPLADVYSLGAILYRTLTGRPPFQSSSPMETILQLLHQDPVAPRSLNPAIPRELETVCLKCLQKDPAKRYSSAAALGEDLARWLRGDPILARPMSTGEKALRWIRKHPGLCSTALVAAAAIVAVMFILAKSNQSLSIERDVALRAQRDADSQRALAESRLTRAIEAIDKNSARVVSRRWAMDPSLQDERKVMLENAIEFYNGLIEDSSDNEVVQFQAVKAHQQIAAVKFQLNDLPGAIEACERSIAMGKRLMIEYPARHEYAAKHASSLSLLGSVTAFGGDMQQGLTQMLEAVRLFQDIARNNTDNLRYQAAALESMTHYAYFVLSSAPDLRKTGQDLMPDVQQIISRLEANPAENSFAQIAIAFGHNVSGAYDLIANNLVEAKQQFEKSRNIIRGIEQVDNLEARHVDGYYHVWAISCVNLATCLVRENPPQHLKAIELLDEGINPLEVLLRIHPNTFVYKMQQLQLLRTKAECLARLSKTDEANEVRTQLAAITAQLTKDNPDLPWVVAMKTPEATIVLVTKVRKGELDGFEAEAEKLLTRTSPNNHEVVIYNVICIYAQAIPHASNQTDRERYLLRVDQLVNELRRHEYFDSPMAVEQAENDPDLLPIKGKYDWHKLGRTQ